MATSAAKNASSFILGCALGAGAAYFASPVDGKRRRHIVRDKTYHWARVGSRSATSKATDISNRARGRIAEMRSRFRSSGEIDDSVLRDRIRADMGHVVTHSSSIEVQVNEGNAILTGPILAHELPALLACVKAIPGIQEVENRLETHAGSDQVPGLQGEGRKGRGGLLRRTAERAKELRDTAASRVSRQRA